MKYDYSIVRFVPDTFRGEFVNVGVIAGSEETGEWDLRAVDNPRRAVRLEGGPRLQAVWQYLAGVAAFIEQASEEQLHLDLDDALRLDRSWLQREHQRLRNIVQLTPPAPVIAGDLQEALNQVFDTLVVDLEKPTRKTRTAAVNALRTAFAQADLRPGDLLHERVTGVVGLQETAIDFAVANGKLAQLAQAWSFQARDTAATVQQIKAWSWTIRDLRELGGKVFTRDRDEGYDVYQSVGVDVVYVEPDSDEGRRSLDEALEVFEHLKVRAVSTADVGDVVDEALRALEEA